MSTLHKDKAHGVLEKKTLALFKKYDADNSKALDKDELKILFRDLCDIMEKPIMTDEQFNIIYHELDEDNNGTVEYDEFKTRVNYIINYIENLNTSSKIGNSLRQSTSKEAVGIVHEVFESDPRIEGNDKFITGLGRQLKIIHKLSCKGNKHDEYGYPSGRRVKGKRMSIKATIEDATIEKTN